MSKAKEKELTLCPDGERHDWAYRPDPPETLGTYVCQRCSLEVPKKEMKEVLG